MIFHMELSKASGTKTTQFLALIEAPQVGDEIGTPKIIKVYVS